MFTGTDDGNTNTENGTVDSDDDDDEDDSDESDEGKNIRIHFPVMPLHKSN